MTVYRKMFSAVALGWVVAAGWQAEAGFVVDNFDGYTLPTNVNQLANGWGADDTTAVVTNLLSDSAPNSVFVPQWLTVSNAVSLSGATYPHVWTECAVYDSGRLIPGTEPVPSGREGVMLGVSTGGYAIVYDPGVTNWVTYTNDVWGTNMYLQANAWAVFSVLENFTNFTAAVFLNGHLMRLGLPFISNSLANYGAFKSMGGNLTNGFLDNVFISNAIPASLTLDLDNDGVADALEVDTYGNVTTVRRLTNTVSVTGSGSINPPGTFTVTWNTNVTYALTGAEAYVVGSLTNNGVTTSFGTKTATYTDLNVTSDRTITAAFVYNGIRYVPGDHTTITGVLAVAQGGDQIVVSNGTYAGSITVSNGVVLIGTNMTGGAGDTNLTISGAMTVVQTGTVYSAGAPGQYTVTGTVSIAAGGLLTISNTAANFGGLSIGGGGMLQVVNGSLVVGSYTNSGPTFTLSLVTNTASSAGNGTITPSGTSTMISTWSNVVYSLLATNAGYVVGAVTNNGVTVGGGALVGAGTKTATYTDPAANITNNQNIIAAFVYNGIRYVPSDHLTITGALAVAQAGDVIVVSNAVYDGSVTLSNGVMLVGTNLGVNATNLTVNGTMTVVTGTVSTAAGAFTVTGQVTIAAGGLLTISNTAVNFNGLTIGAGGEVQVVNGTVTANGVTQTGTFTLDASSFNFKASMLNFTDGFENYLPGVTLASLGAFGWAATDAGAVVTNGAAVVSQGAKAAFIPAGVSVSNTVSAAGITNVWTELYVKDDAQVTPETQPPVVANSAVMVYFGTNGYLTVYNHASNAWDVCSNDVTMGPVARVNAGQWARVSIFQNFSNHTAAIFLNDQLLREQVPFISAGVSQYGSLSVVGGQSGAAGLDAVKIWTNVVPGLVGDLNFDRIPDASEIALNGSIRVYPGGSVFLIR
ncbi:MAG: hypothetical protein WCS52_19005 [bacterium]